MRLRSDCTGAALIIPLCHLNAGTSHASISLEPQLEVARYTAGGYGEGAIDREEQSSELIDYQREHKGNSERIQAVLEPFHGTLSLHIVLTLD